MDGPKPDLWSGFGLELGMCWQVYIYDSFVYKAMIFHQFGVCGKSDPIFLEKSAKHTTLSSETIALARGNGAFFPHQNVCNLLQNFCYSDSSKLRFF